MEDLPSGLINLDTIINDDSVYAAEALVSYAKLLSKSRLSVKNSALFIKILSTNNINAADSLFNGRDPFSMFSNVPAGRQEVSAVLDILVSHSPKTLYGKIFLACLGILSAVYSHPEQGMKTYPLTVSDLQHIAKYFVSEDENLKDNILNLFYKLESLPGQYSIAAFASRAVSVFHDPSKRLDSIVPPLLLRS